MVDDNMITYIGNSMFPTLKTGDILRVVQYSQREIHAGDVIAFHSPNGGALIAHRVVSVDQMGLRTKGDNCLKNDDWVLSPNDNLGRIVSVQRGRKKVIILNGFWGKQHALSVRSARTVKGIIRALFSVVLSPVYHWLAETGIFRKLFSRRLSSRLCCFKHGYGLELRLLIGQLVIGRLLPGQKQWYIKRPFRLFVDEAALPGNNLGDLISSRHTFLEPKRS